ncbi:hypothetical protein AVEN_68752-1 [Araneus ventricosus]|uniref:Uncharacterized protein n=1 Tax=Araneus ventricosus TaxID=182803 RepID=A0A4Y2C5W0_ARAVE|nr:hypothetical protein AVEN_68752-1 [Araneus ventricosus]
MDPPSANLDIEAQVWTNLNGNLFDRKLEKPSFKVDDMVFISKRKERFEKGYGNNLSREIFTVHKVLPRIHVVFKLCRDFNNGVIAGRFYEKEIQKVKDSGKVLLLNSLHLYP